MKILAIFLYFKVHNFPKINIFKFHIHFQPTFFKAVLLRYQTQKSIFFRFFSPKGPPFGFWKLWSKMRNYTKVSGKKQKQIWNQWAKLFHLPPVDMNFIFGTILMYILLTYNRRSLNLNSAKSALILGLDNWGIPCLTSSF